MRVNRAGAAAHAAIAASCAAGTAAANTSNGYNLPIGVTSLSEAM